MDKAALVRTIRIARATSRQALLRSAHRDKALACNACNDAYAAAEKLALDGKPGWQEHVRSNLSFAKELEQLALAGDDSQAAAALAALGEQAC